jgi:hypothetical protein
MSGKAMQGAVPPNVAADREVVRRIEESGHARVSGLFITNELSTSRAKTGKNGRPATAIREINDK